MMKNISKEKREQLIITIIGTVIVVAGIVFGLIRPTSAKIAELKLESNTLSDDLTKARRRIKVKDDIDLNLADVSKKLDDIQENMPSGDLYASMINTLNNIKVKHRINIPQISREVTGRALMYPDFPYIVATFRVGGDGYFHDIGSFIADFENSFPFMRVQNLVIEKANAIENTASGSEKLSFRMEIVALLNKQPDANTATL